MTHHHLLQESIALTLVSGNDRIDRTAIVNAIGKIVPVTDVESFGNLGDFNKWFINFKSALSKEKFLKLEKLKVNDQLFAIHKPYREVKLIRLLNIPTAISDDYVREIAMKWGGTVISVDCETLPRPYASIKTFVRRIRMRFTAPACTNRRLYASVANGSPKLLVTPTTGSPGFQPAIASTRLYPRIKVCHKCKQSGHLKKNCTVDQHGVVRSSTPIPSEFADEVQDGVRDDVLGDAEASVQSAVQGGEQASVLGVAQADGQGVFHAGVQGDAQAEVQGDDPTDIQGVVLVNVKDVVQTDVQGDVQHNVDGDEFDIPHLAATDGRDEPVAVTLLDEQGGGYELRSQINDVNITQHLQLIHPLQSTPTQPVVMSNGNDVDTVNRGSRDLADIVAYKAYKEGRSILKRPLSDEQYPIIKDPKKQHHPTSPSMQGKVKEDGEL